MSDKIGLGDSHRDNPLVSIAIVTYNQRELLRECLESVLLQDYENLEIVIADDGSTDGTPQLMRDYEASGRAKFVLRANPINQGITLNQCLAQSACSGKYIAWMAGDDLMLPGKISKQVAFLEEHPDYAVCYHDLDVFNSDTGLTIRRYSEIDIPRSGDIRTSIEYGCFNGAVSNMVRASCQPTPPFDPRIPIASDWLYWIECLWSGGKIGYIDEVLGRYRRHANNITSSSVREPSLKEIQDHLFTCDIVESRAPQFRREVAVRRAYIIGSLRWLDGGARYREYLRLSLSHKFTLKIFVGYLFTFVGKKL